MTPNKAVERTAAPLCSFGCSGDSGVIGFGVSLGRAAVAHLGRWTKTIKSIRP
jgi:hypothetical protein